MEIDQLNWLFSIAAWNIQRYAMENDLCQNVELNWDVWGLAMSSQIHRVRVCIGFSYESRNGGSFFIFVMAE